MNLPTEPFGARSVSLGLHLQPLAASEAVRALLAEAAAAETAGFHGLTVGEHHGGFPGYPPQPLHVAGWMLDVTTRAWAAACPVLLPLRNPALVAEEVAWLAARFPGRVGFAAAPGYQARDFQVTGTDPEQVRGAFRPAFGALVRALSGHAREGLADDPALRACRERPIPVLSSASTASAARWAGGTGAGVILSALLPYARAATLFDRYVAGGGAGPRVLIRWAWVGTPPAGSMEALVGGFTAATTPDAPPAFLPATGANPLISGTADEVATELSAAIRESGATALNLRVHLPGTDHHQVLDQLRAFGDAVLPAIRWPD